MAVMPFPGPVVGSPGCCVGGWCCNAADQRQAFPAGLVDDGQDAELTAIMRPPFDKVVGPHMAGIFRPQPDARSVVKP